MYIYIGLSRVRDYETNVRECIFIYVYIYIYVYKYMYMYMHMHMYMYMYICMYVCNVM